nr:hypothetical protein [Tanacetum cinerariifolium]
SSHQQLLMTINAAEKALMQAATPATENARRRPEAESTLEAK